MTGDRLQQQCAEIIQAYGSADSDVTVATLALCGEAGEVANDVKKFRYGRFNREELRERSKKEIMDCLWYLTCIALSLELNLSELMAGTPAHIESKIARHKEKQCLSTIESNAVASTAPASVQ